MNHTPGPWEVHEGQDYIGVMRGDETTEQGIRVDNIEDARLIAAAPELLEDVKWLFEQLDNGTLVRDTTKDDGPGWHLRALKFVARLAKVGNDIAKAEGKA